ncbi:nitrogenase molybdenum-iron protein beta chain [Sporobacter termitidis DSM 10068]|uniref:Nitrogenase molybdenum-iron protein beta chain n=1 Tax=Sporobacter termitidis DSM 10068 TaxID=1123282 RepID=A0A1M5XFH7_9FIRM|nr:nitrogenase component 1 [Sporobacter termitidis]SHH98570.1 nitrogenase molybdenum-iron protein beta chain [Sporobacter termitidis DSM 10068]
MSSYIERPRYFCSLGGALSTLEALPETIPILHCAIGCAGSIAWAQNGGSALQVGGYCGGLAVPSSNVGERDVIFGGIDRLEEQVKTTLELMDGRLYVIVTGCVTEIIGDNVRAVAAEFAGQGVDIVAANTGGFKGNSYLGYDIVLSEIVRQYVKKGAAAKKGSVNILGIVPYMDGFWRGNLTGVRRLLGKLGIEVNTFFTDEDTLDGLKNSSSAELNIVLSDVYGLDTAKTYEEVHGIPYITAGLPVGPTASGELLRAVAGALRLDVDVEAIIREENRKYYKFLEPLADVYNDADLQKYAVIVADVNYAVSITRFLLDDLGWIPVLTQFTDVLPEEQQEQLRKKLTAPAPLNGPKVVFDTNASEAIRYINELYPKQESDKYAETLTPAFVIGSALERSLALKLGAPHLSVSFPISNRALLSRGYTGFEGGLTLIEDLLSAAVAAR